MSVTTLPSVFAVYRPETNTFSLFEPDVVLNGVIYAIRPWYRPVKSCWNACSDKERSQIRRWFDGRRWYVVKQPTQKVIQDVLIQKKPYITWSLGHSLVWAPRLSAISTQCPSVPILEFNSQKLLAVHQSGFQAVWVNVQPSDSCTERVWTEPRGRRVLSCTEGTCFMC